MKLNSELEKLKKKIMKLSFDGLNNEEKGYYNFWMTVIAGVETGMSFNLVSIEDGGAAPVSYEAVSITPKKVIALVDGKETSFNILSLESQPSLVYKQSRKEKYFVICPKK